MKSNESELSEARPLTEVHHVEGEFGRQIVTIMSLLGSISFAGLVLILSFPSEFQVGKNVGLLRLAPEENFEVLVFLLAATSLFSLVGSFVMALSYSTKVRGNKRLRLFSTSCLFLGVVSFGISVPYMIFPSSAMAGGAVEILDGLLFSVLAILILIEGRSTK